MRMYDLYVKLFVPTFSQCAVSWLICCVAFACYIGEATAYNTSESARLRTATEQLFYHGYESYMKYAFPEDEIRPLSCQPHTRDRDNPGHFEINDALGNYSLTLIDSLSTLAILASSPALGSAVNKPLVLFQDGIKSVVEQYGDGTQGRSGLGSRARGFDLDSKVQVFETVIRGLGGLLSGHLFAIGELPIRGYSPLSEAAGGRHEWFRSRPGHNLSAVLWPNGFTYNGQLLRLAYDLGQRLIPAFWTQTGIPYPRVNLRTGIPFYAKSPRNYNPNEGQCTEENTEAEETTETCSAGAGSLVLEFSILSRLTGDSRFEELAKRAFWGIWSRRSQINLIGAGIDAETGEWIGHYTGIGAGIDSFFEYAFKSYILLQQDSHPLYDEIDPSAHPGSLFPPLPDQQSSAEAFHQVWETAHAAISRHLLRSSNYQHPHYIQGDLHTGAGRAFWIDSLSAYFPGLLTLSGHVEAAIESHLLVTALWTRFSALPERYNVITGGIEGGLGWWPGRPEFIESNYYLYRATEDPWYKYVAEMALHDIERRCWARCGWSGLQNVLTGEKADRMESFFLGETAKYLFLTFDDGHPLNHMDAPFVFSTEGHPLIIPKKLGSSGDVSSKGQRFQSQIRTCPPRSANIPFGISATASRGDVFHAASLAKLHRVFRPGQDQLSESQNANDDTNTGLLSDESPSNFAYYYPWTLPPRLVPFNATSSPMRTHPTFELTFPSMLASGTSMTPLQKAIDGIQINSLSGLRLSLIKDVPLVQDGVPTDMYRIHYINSYGLGRDEKVYLTRDGGFGTIDPDDPNFTKMRDSQILDVIIDLGRITPARNHNDTASEQSMNVADPDDASQGNVMAAWNSIVSQITNLLHESQHIKFPFESSGSTVKASTKAQRIALSGIIPTGIGAAPIPDWPEVHGVIYENQPVQPLLWTKIFATDELCDHKLSRKIPREHQVIVIKRGKCSFSKKLSNIPLFPQSSQSLQLVVMVNYGSDDGSSDDQAFFRPLLDQVQKSSSGLPRPSPIPMVMIGGGDKTYWSLQHARGLGIRRRYTVQSQGVLITNVVII